MSVTDEKYLRVVGVHAFQEQKKILERAEELGNYDYALEALSHVGFTNKSQKSKYKNECNQVVSKMLMRDRLKAKLEQRKHK